MNWNDHIEFVKETVTENIKDSLYYVALKLVGEYGEFCLDKSIDELGDFCWYVADYHRRLDISPQTAWEYRIQVGGMLDGWLTLSQISELIGKTVRRNEVRESDKQILIYYSRELMGIVGRLLESLNFGEIDYGYTLDQKLSIALEANQKKLTKRKNEGTIKDEALRKTSTM